MLALLAAIAGASPLPKPPGDLWSTNYASDTFNYDLPWNDWEITTATFPNAKRSSANSTASTRPTPVPSGMDMKVLKELTSDLGRNQAISPFVVSEMMSKVWLAAEGISRNEVRSGELGRLA